MFLDLEFAGTLSLSLPLKNRIPRSSTLITAVFAREYTQIGLFNNLGRDGGRRTGLESSGRLKASFYRGARARREREPENGERGETGQPIRREQAGQDEKQDAAGQGAFVKGTTKKDHDFSRVCVCVCVCVFARGPPLRFGGPTLSLARNCEIAGHGGTNEAPIRNDDYYCISTWLDARSCQTLRVPSNFHYHSRYVFKVVLEILYSQNDEIMFAKLIIYFVLLIIILINNTKYIN